MKRILLTTTALVLTAGIAAADVTFSGTVTLGYNDTDHNGAAGSGLDEDLATPLLGLGNDGIADAANDNAYDDDADPFTYNDGGEKGFYVNGDLNISMTTELDNGLTAGADFEIDYWDGDQGNGTLSASDAVVYLKSDNAALYYGDTSMAATKHWASAGDMEADGFSSGSDDAVLRGDVSFGDTSVSMSVVNGNNGDTEQLSLGVSGSAGSFTYALGFQEAAGMRDTGAAYVNVDTGIEDSYTNGSGDFNNAEVFGISAGMTFGGATVTLAYASSDDKDIEAANRVKKDSTGIKVAYPIGDVTLTAYYVSESASVGGVDAGVNDNYGINVAYASGPLAIALDYQDDQGTEKVGLTGSYDLGNGMVVYAGVTTDQGGSDHEYLGVSYDLGGGASALFSYATDSEMGDTDDEIGPNDYKEGLTVEVAFKF